MKSTPCNNHVLVVQGRQARFLEIELLFLKGNLGHQEGLKGRLLSNRASAVDLISDGNLDDLCRCPVPSMLGYLVAHPGRRCFVDVFGFMQVRVLLPNADGGGICTCRLLIFWWLLG